MYNFKSLKLICKYGNLEFSDKNKINSLSRWGENICAFCVRETDVDRKYFHLMCYNCKNIYYKEEWKEWKIKIYDKIGLLVFECLIKKPNFQINSIVSEMFVDI